MIDDEAKRDPEKYKKWYADFQMFLKEGITVDQENKEALFKLLRFETKNGKAREYTSTIESPCCSKVAEANMQSRRKLRKIMHARKHQAPASATSPTSHSSENRIQK